MLPASRSTSAGSEALANSSISPNNRRMAITSTRPLAKRYQPIRTQRRSIDVGASSDAWLQRNRERSTIARFRTRYALVQTDVVVIGAGAAGLMCAFTAAARRQVLLLDHANKAGKKILMSGGGRCNFTNLYTEPANFLSSNPHFCKSALARYTQWDFIEMVSRHGVPITRRSSASCSAITNPATSWRCCWTNACGPESICAWTPP